MDEFTERAVQLSAAVAEGRITEDQWAVAMDKLAAEFGIEVFRF